MKNKTDLDTLEAVAVEAEADPGRHDMEAAVLATVARLGLTVLDHTDLWTAFGQVAWSRKDFAGIADALEAVTMDGKPPDAVLVKGSLPDAALVNPDTLTGILDGSKAKEVAVAVEYLRIMAGQDRFARADDMVRDMAAAVKKAKDAGGDVEGAVAGLLKDAFDLVRSKNLVRTHPSEREDDLDAWLKTLKDRHEDGRDYIGLDSGFRHLNEVLNGLTAGVFIMAGAPSTGKTTLVKQIADQVAALEKVPVLFYSFEQSKEELRIKSLSRMASINSRDIWKGRAAEDWSQVEKAADKYRRGPGRWLTIIEAGREDHLDAIRAAAVMAKHKAGDKPILLVLDFLQIIPAGKDAPEDARARIDYVLTELRRLSRDIQSPVLVISSQNRESYRKNKPPSLAALKESGGIEYSADAVICLWRNKEESERLTEDFNRLTVRVEAHVLKNRNGELSRIKLDFTPAWSMFTEQEKDALGYDAALGEA